MMAKTLVARALLLAALIVLFVSILAKVTPPTKHPLPSTDTCYSQEALSTNEAVGEYATVFSDTKSLLQTECSAELELKCFLPFENNIFMQFVDWIVGVLHNQNGVQQELPFGYLKNHCLWGQFQKEIISKPCFRALCQFQHVALLLRKDLNEEKATKPSYEKAFLIVGCLLLNLLLEGKEDKEEEQQKGFDRNENGGGNGRASESSSNEQHFSYYNDKETESLGPATLVASPCGALRRVNEARPS